MTLFVQADIPATEHLLAHLPFTSHASVVNARVLLGEQLRLTMQYPQTYQTPLAQHLPAGMGVEHAAQYVHPFNIACALMNVCLAAQRYGTPLAPQEDLMVYVGEWEPLSRVTVPPVVVPGSAEPAPAVTAAPVEAQPAPIAEAQPAPIAVTHAQAVAANASETMPDPAIGKERTGQSGRPQKSPFEKKVTARQKVAEPPFWWSHLMVSAHRVLTHSPASALDDSSEGAGPVQAYMVLVGILQLALKDVPAHATAADLRHFLDEITAQVAVTEHHEAINQLRTALVR